MSPLVWTAAPLVVTVLVAAFLSWRARPRRPGEPFDTVEEHARFRAALARCAQRPAPPVTGVDAGPAGRPDTLT